MSDVITKCRSSQSTNNGGLVTSVMRVGFYQHDVVETPPIDLTAIENRLTDRFADQDTFGPQRELAK